MLYCVCVPRIAFSPFSVHAASRRRRRLGWSAEDLVVLLWPCLAFLAWLGERGAEEEEEAAAAAASGGGGGEGGSSD